MCGFEPRMRSRTSCWRPVISASAMTSAITPTVTPSVEMNEMTEMNACLRLASRYRTATWSSNGRSTFIPLAAGPHPRRVLTLMPRSGCSGLRSAWPQALFPLAAGPHPRRVLTLTPRRGSAVRGSVWPQALLSFSLPHEREQNHISNRWTVREQHHQAIDADALPAGRRQAVFEGADVVLVHLVRFEIAALAVLRLRFEAAALLQRVVQLAEGVGDLEAGDIEVEALHRVRIAGLLLRQRRYLGRKVVDESRLNQLILAEPLEHFGGDLASAVARFDLDVQLSRHGGHGVGVPQIGVADLTVQP